MKDIYISDQISLSEGKFMNDKDIDEVVFGSDIKYIPESCFYNCNNLKKIVFEGNIQDIEPAAFMNCGKLKTIDAKNINAIKDFAFYGCDNIADFNIDENIANNIKYGINNNTLSEYFILPEVGTPLNDISWRKINLISKKGKAKEYFKVGDEKELTILEGEYLDPYKLIKTQSKNKYHVQILGFDHDDLSDGTGKAGITFGLKEIMMTEHIMNSTATNVGGWAISDMRRYVNNDIYNNLPSDLRSVIKTINKLSNTSVKETTLLTTTKDKLFLFSTTEIGLNSNYNVDGQGNKYEYFIDDKSKVKYRGGFTDWWWLRSIHTDSIYSFSIYGPTVFNNNNEFSMADDTLGIVFGFCI